MTVTGVEWSREYLAVAQAFGIDTKPIHPSAWQIMSISYAEQVWSVVFFGPSFFWSVGPSVRRSVGRSVRRSVGPSVRRAVGPSGRRCEMHTNYHLHKQFHAAVRSYIYYSIDRCLFVGFVLHRFTSACDPTNLTIVLRN